MHSAKDRIVPLKSLGQNYVLSLRKKQKGRHGSLPLQKSEAEALPYEILLRSR